jgi:hypothetical protein
MPGFDDDLLDAEDTKLPYIYEGVVVDRNDPEKLGRIRFAVPGLIEPASPWAYPASTLGGGSKDCGFFAVPEKGAGVYVFFVGGDIDEPRYFAGHWGLTNQGNEVPEEAQHQPPDNRVLATNTSASSSTRARARRSSGSRTARPATTPSRTGCGSSGTTGIAGITAS